MTQSVLVVDDEEDVRQIIGRQFLAAGLKPGLGLFKMALRAASVAAGMVHVMGVPAAVAAEDLPAQFRRATAQDVRDGADRAPGKRLKFLCRSNARRHIGNLAIAPRKERPCSTSPRPILRLPLLITC